MTMPKPTQECIREMAIRGSSQREMARALHVSRNTVSKYLSEDLPPAPPMRPPHASPTTEPFAEEVSSWLEADLLVPRKQRHTAKRVHDRLVAEHGFGGSLSTVERFVRDWRESRPQSPTDGCADAPAKLHDLLISPFSADGRLDLESVGSLGEAIVYQFAHVYADPTPWRRCENCGRVFKKYREEMFRRNIRETHFCRRSCNVSFNQRNRR